MSIESKITVGERLVIFKKTSTCRDASRLGKYIESYLDETQKTEAMELPEIGTKRILPKEVMERMAKSGAKVDLKAGVDYLTKREKGDIHVMGFMRDNIQKASGKLIENMTNREIADATAVAWKALIDAKGLIKVAHKIVIALDPAFCNLLTQSKLPIDEELTKVISEALARYTKKFYPGEELGYLMGIHHDKKHIHGHVLLYPQTNKGTPLNISHWSTVKLGEGGYARVDYQGFIKYQVEKLTKQLYHQKIKYPAIATAMPVEYQCQHRLITEIAIKQCEVEMAEDKKKGLPVDPKELWMRAKARRKMLLELPDAQLRAVLTEGYEERKKAFEDLDKLAPHELQERMVATEEQQKKVKEELKKTAGTSEAWETKIGLNELRKSVSKDVFKYKKFLFNAKDWGWTIPSFMGSHQGRWYLKRMRKEDKLGKIMRKAFIELGDTTQDIVTRDTLRNLKAHFSGPKGKARLPMHIAQGWVMRKAAVDKQLIQLKRFQKERKEEISRELNLTAERKRKENERIQELRLMLHLLSLDRVDLNCKSKKMTPIYMRQYIGWKTMSTPIPISLLRPGVAAEEKEALTQEQRKKQMEMYKPIHKDFANGQNTTFSTIVTKEEAEERERERLEDEIPKKPVAKAEPGSNNRMEKSEEARKKAEELIASLPEEHKGYDPEPDVISSKPGEDDEIVPTMGSERLKKILAGNFDALRHLTSQSKHNRFVRRQASPNYTTPESLDLLDI